MSKDSIFCDLFSRPEYCLQLYKVLHPEDTDVREENIVLMTLSSLMMRYRYNDLGFLVRDRLLVLVECQSTFTENILVRFILYLADTYNRYISKMVTQISEDFARYNLYADIMDYDDMNSAHYDGIEIYIKKAGEYFSELPPANTPVDTVIRSMYEASLRFWGKPNDFAMLLGYIDSRGKLTLFGGDREKQTVTLTDKDKLVVFTNH